MPQEEPEIDLTVIQALAHPLRLRILKVLQTKILSPKMMAAELKEPLGDVAYHTRVLKELGCLELVRKEPRRGVAEHFFRANPGFYVGGTELRKVPRVVRSSFSWSALRAFFRRAVAAIKDGTMDDREDTVFTWTVITVDERGWIDMVHALTEAGTRLMEIHNESRDRLVEAGVDGMPVVVGLAGFEAPQ